MEQTFQKEFLSIFLYHHLLRNLCTKSLRCNNFSYLKEVNKELCIKDDYSVYYDTEREKDVDENIQYFEDTINFLKKVNCMIEPDNCNNSKTKSFKKVNGSISKSLTPKKKTLDKKISMQNNAKAKYSIANIHDFKDLKNKVRLLDEQDR